ncbi:MAG: aspartate carbamoyltransferase catalytic subunit [Calditrichaeota bacterium]|nr:aspartate carbamoyltransferase catalytic subunit [Calditrichota bacterium]MCB0288711.1 aspartate carbamoyltransferase catalytic subunit [Calditrichota bacterium]MCB0302613.1 aspartate carbamoyltransferase catalytic subunit [Calditrichota bacterium]MCB0316012.1 aspartate carbamoyltransferase catalytic subunit [Calditrichota bacterium]MCB9088409.1 aspartate carbamoyltransferase catalytic subunit [Calditrichia bacterium]
MLKSRHLLGLDGMEKPEIELLLNTARSFREILDRPIKRVPTLQGKTVVNLFYEPSTRTRISFELAEKRMSADIVNFSAGTSSVKKGESLIDTVKNIEAMKIDMVVVRHSSPGAAHLLSQVLDANIINAGDGGHEHPTQALLDMMTIRERFGNLAKLTIGLIGDISHSRVALSNIFGLKAMGARVLVCGPSTLIPRGIERLGVEVFHNIDEVIPQVDVLNILRLQLERQKSGLFPSLREYHNFFGITRERLERAEKPILIMHPGPMNRGLEISSHVADSEHSVILEQVTNGIALRMAVLYLLAGGKSEIH